MDPVSDGSHSLVGIRAPTVVFYGGRYHVFATIVDSAGAVSMEHVQFADWPNAGGATVDYLDNNPGFKGARSQPQVFYLNTKKTWYLISQGPAPSYSTNSDLGQTSGWSQPTNFYSTTPSIVTQNAGAGGIPWTDPWIICNSSDCYLFFTNTIGYLFRAKTSLTSFPSGFGDPVIVKQSATSVAGGPRVYKMDGGTGGYLMLLEGNGSGGRYIGAWSAAAIDAADKDWKALADTEANPFAGAKNASFVKVTWTRDVSHGELIRTGYDETMAVDNCNMRYLYAGHDPFTTVSTELLPWKLGLLVRSK
jgi:endo-1,4-beta-xylanase